MMKNKIYLGIILLFVALVGCQTDDAYDAPTELSDVGFYTSQGQALELQLNVFDFMTFSDLSQGATDHTWFFDTGISMLEGPIERNDTDYEARIIYPGARSSNEKTINLYFQESGIKTVRLYNTFKDSVTFRGNNGVDDYYVGSEWIDNKWVIDTTFNVKVFDTIISEIIVKQNSQIVNHKSTDTIYVEAGELLEFTDITTIGEPTGRTWNIFDLDTETNYTSSSDSIANIQFNKLGNFRGSISTNRSGENIPADGDVYGIPAPIKVVASSKTFEINDDIYEMEDETIVIAYNGEFEPFTNQEQFFTVMVNGVQFPVASVEINGNDATKLNLTLADPIYRPDVITVSYTGTEIKSTDTRTASMFSDVPVIMDATNLVPENLATLEANDGAWTNFWSNEGTVSYSTEQAASGSYSLKLEIASGQAKAEADGTLDQALDFDGTKTYTVTYKMFIADGATGTDGKAEIKLFLLTNWDWNSSDDNFLQPSGQWVTVSKDYNSTKPLSKFYLRILSNASKTTNATVYFDDFTIMEKEVRP
ncbi:SwmB domain-containing protein [Tamlana sp. 2_MG-2023]|uniref:SwmB domain-containing protein n=1 Tax=unclassified Tamlana TaxID=2614803 RepID=UPI0026E131CE|nr:MULTISPECIES: SwmB domain-containing protein [unclassified Tamlana]MDO6761289.1 SwmB domain-containing protein [Tamlana sp. 2_MG-2023]MDO6791772.1 SwmB domain-containing protein [Tamlana sp. 1_MG-2023]